MKTRLFLFAGCAALLQVMPATAATLNVTATATPDAGLYDYSYQFSISGADLSVDNVFLGSADLSPLHVTLTLDGTAAGNWSWLGNDSPQNYLQFFSSDGSLLSASHVLGVTFSSALIPTSSHFAIGLNSLTSGETNTVSGVLAPSVSAVPEPGSLWMLLVGVVAILVVTAARAMCCPTRLQRFPKVPKSKDHPGYPAYS